MKKKRPDTFGLAGMKFFDQAGNLIVKIGYFEQSGGYSNKEIFLAADERIVGVTGRNPHWNDLQLMIARL
jgi:hypothetical protein